MYVVAKDTGPYILLPVVLSRTFCDITETLNPKPETLNPKPSPTSCATEIHRVLVEDARSTLHLRSWPVTRRGLRVQGLRLKV